MTDRMRLLLARELQLLVDARGVMVCQEDIGDAAKDHEQWGCYEYCRGTAGAY